MAKTAYQLFMESGSHLPYFQWVTSGALPDNFQYPNSLDSKHGEPAEAEEPPTPDCSV